MQTKFLTTQWQDYQLIDSGEGEKLERFGKYTLIRPEPQAIWDKTLSEKEWTDLSQTTFKREGRGEDMGEWMCEKGMPERWKIGYNYKNMKLNMSLRLTAFKHVGVFPEQSSNWNFIYDSVKALGGNSDVKVLNLFAYTGCASLAARSAGADVTHVDSIKQVVAWAKDNMELSELTDIRWIVEDAMKFVKREVRRGKRYHGIMLDPPAYGRGTDGERWILEKDLNEMLKECAKLLEPNGFLVLSLYSMGLSALLAKTVANQAFGVADSEELGELYFNDEQGKSLPMGVYYRFLREK